jgi:hypothetical protein
MLLVTVEDVAYIFAGVDVAVVVVVVVVVVLVVVVVVVVVHVVDVLVDEFFSSTVEVLLSIW